MQTKRLSQLIHRAVGTLQELGMELEALDASPPAPSTCDRFTEPSGREAAIAARLKSFWKGVTLSAICQVGGETIDLSTPQGRWELLALAVLRGARVQERVAEQTFHALRTAGLLDLERASEGRSEDRRSAIDILIRSYHALGKKESKVNALFANAALLVARWSGDLNALYEATRGDDRALLSELRTFHQINQTALWIARTLKVHGVWPDVGNEAVRHFDRYIRLPIERLGLLPHDTRGDARRLPDEIGSVVDALLEGDSIPFFLNGSTLCSHDDPAVCLCECPVSAWCRFPMSAGAKRGGRRADAPD